MLLYHITESKNLDNILKEGLQPLIGPRSQMAEETINKIYFFDSILEAENALENWLGELFDEEIELVLLQVEVLDELIKREAFEYFVTEKINKNFIKVLNYI